MHWSQYLFKFGDKTRNFDIKLEILFNFDFKLTIINFLRLKVIVYFKILLINEKFEIRMNALL